MRVVAHISDLHFGRDLSDVAAGLQRDLAALRPDLVIASGDFTQRARRAEFAAARDYLRALPAPVLAIPGNHDVPLFDVLRRFLAPLARYRRYIDADVNPAFTDDELFVLGVNTARSFTWKNGRISVAQIETLRRRLPEAGTRLKVVVTHHPFLPPPGDVGIDLVGRAARAIEMLAAHKVDLLLAGHLHQGYAGDIRTHYPGIGRAMLVVQAGTAISCRTREREPNAYNVLRLTRTHIEVEVRRWDGARFAPVTRRPYQREHDGWMPVANGD